MTFATKHKEVKPKKINKKMYRSAMRSIWSKIVENENLVIVKEIQIDEPPKSSQVKTILSNLGVQRALIIISETNENLLKAGKYGFFTIPNKDKWTIIFNENWNQHGKDDYNESEDVLRFDVTPKISEKITEQLIYHVERINDQEGTISLSWEKVLVKFSFVLSQT